MDQLDRREENAEEIAGLMEQGTEAPNRLYRRATRNEWAPGPEDPMEDKERSANGRDCAGSSFESAIEAAAPVTGDDESCAVKGDGAAPTTRAEADDAESEAADVPKVSRKVRRRRKRSRPRSKTIAMKRLTREELRRGALLYPPVDIPRPQTRMECSQESRPCPWVACKHHLYLDVNPETGSIKINFPDLEPWELPYTCALDVADRGGITLEEVGEIMNLTRERIRQVEVRGLNKLRASSPSPEEIGAVVPDETQ